MKIVVRGFVEAWGDGKVCWTELLYTGEQSESFQKLASRLTCVSSIKHAFQPGLMKDNGSATMIVALMQVYRAKDIIYSYIYKLFTAMSTLGAKCHYFHRISLFRGVGG